MPKKTIFNGYKIDKKVVKTSKQPQALVVQNNSRDFIHKLISGIQCSTEVQNILIDIITSVPTDCTQVNTCVNTQLGLPNAGSLTNFSPAVISAMVDYFNQTGVQAPTAAEVCAYLSSLAQNTTIDATTKLVLGSCEYGTVGDLATYLSSVNDIALYEISTDNGILYTFMDGSTKSLKTGHAETITPTVNTPYTITHNLNSTRIHVEARDVGTNKMVDVEFSNRTLNTVDVTSTTIDDLEIIIKI
ncbi:MAG TPA: hypothetical protein PLW93_04395 [Candidatus Absconditabacterales bacterium]|nr:hypothetical protein [Candidatus Absconditabacterales bacterium]